MLDSAELRVRLTAVRERIARAAERARRDPGTIRLVAISKTFGDDYVRAAADAGQVDFGENKVQEALGKMGRTADLPIRWHLVGHLQSNKVNKAGTSFDMVHSVDNVAIGGALDRAATGASHPLDLLVQVDLAREPTKHGATEAELPAIFESARQWRRARLVGLMVLPPAVSHPDDARPHFQALRSVRERLLDGGAEPSMLKELSMGMSVDFEIAVEEGATLVRVGSAIFGDRRHV